MVQVDTGGQTNKTKFNGFVLVLIGHHVFITKIQYFTKNKLKLQGYNECFNSKKQFLIEYKKTYNRLKMFNQS